MPYHFFILPIPAKSGFFLFNFKVGALSRVMKYATLAYKTYPFLLPIVKTVYPTFKVLKIEKIDTVP